MATAGSQIIALVSIPRRVADFGRTGADACEVGARMAGDCRPASAVCGPCQQALPRVRARFGGWTRSRAVQNEALISSCLPVLGQRIQRLLANPDCKPLTKGFCPEKRPPPGPPLPCIHGGRPSGVIKQDCTHHSMVPKIVNIAVFGGSVELYFELAVSLQSLLPVHLEKNCVASRNTTLIY